MGNKYLIVADDFTGSNDTGVQMRKRGIQVEVTLFPDAEIEIESMVLDTESRNIPAESAYKKVKDMTSKVMSQNTFDIVFKKIDSTLRGNVVAEIKALDDVYGATKVIFAPAFPKINRITEDGIHKLNGIRLMETEMVRDPLSPITTDNIVTLLEKGYNEKVNHHTLNEIRTGKIDVTEGKFHTFDVTETRDLQLIADSILKLDEKILWVGSAGLANSIFDILYPQYPAMAVVGSISETSFKQINYAEEKGVPIVQLKAEDIINETNHQNYIDRILSLIREGKDLILTATRARADYEYSIRYAKEKAGLSNIETSRYVQRYLSSVTKQVLLKTELSGIFLTGGDTAIAVIEQMKASGCAIQVELMPGIVLSKLVGGEKENLSIISKAGAFGVEKDLFECLGKIKEK
ncbi:MAG: four-carbon acid sugar kinase family protein [Lachnospiraceae bacterium]|nr:four-carbon acid sugar kinase family protein [Lachnospiraceae bacterium]